MTWNTHADVMFSRASRTLGLVRWNLSLANTTTKRPAYKTLVRSKIEYASLIWNPPEAYLIHKLESLRNKAALFITKNYLQTSSWIEIKYSIDLVPLETRKLVALISFFHKIYDSPSSRASFHIKEAHHASTRLDHQRKVEHLFTRTHLFFNSPLLYTSHPLLESAFCWYWSYH